MKTIDATGSKYWRHPNSLFPAVLTLAFLASLSSCTRSGEIVWVEVEPGRFIDVEKWDTDNSTKISVRKAGQSLTWHGPEIPFALRQQGQRIKKINEVIVDTENSKARLAKFELPIFAKN